MQNHISYSSLEQNGWPESSNQTAIGKGLWLPDDRQNTTVGFLYFRTHQPVSQGNSALRFTERSMDQVTSTPELTVLVQQRMGACLCILPFGEETENLNMCRFWHNHAVSSWLCPLTSVDCAYLRDATYHPFPVSLPTVNTVRKHSQPQRRAVWLCLSSLHIRIRSFLQNLHQVLWYRAAFLIKSRIVNLRSVK